MSDAAGEPGTMSEDAARDEIARLEKRIEALTDSLERCRKFALTARLLLSAGAIWTLLMVLRVIPFAPIHIVGAIATLLGGIVLFGSNASTWKQTTAARAEAESRRAALIDGMALRTVEEETSVPMLPRT
jgi:hypothetical protein